MYVYYICVYNVYVYYICVYNVYVYYMSVYYVTCMCTYLSCVLRIGVTVSDLFVAGYLFVFC